MSSSLRKYLVSVIMGGMSEESKPPPVPKRSKGRPKKYKTDGAPQVTIRLNPDVYEWLKEQPGGLRVTVQRLAYAEMKKAPPESEADAESGA